MLAQSTASRHTAAKRAVCGVRDYSNSPSARAAAISSSDMRATALYTSKVCSPKVGQGAYANGGDALKVAGKRSNPYEPSVGC